MPEITEVYLESSLYWSHCVFDYLDFRLLQSNVDAFWKMTRAIFVAFPNGAGYKCFRGQWNIDGLIRNKSSTRCLRKGGYLTCTWERVRAGPARWRCCQFLPIEMFPKLLPHRSSSSTPRPRRSPRSRTSTASQIRSWKAEVTPCQVRIITHQVVYEVLKDFLILIPLK